MDGIRKKITDISAPKKSFLEKKEMVERKVVSETVSAEPKAVLEPREKTVIQGDSNIIITDAPGEATFPELEIPSQNFRLPSRFWTVTGLGVLVIVTLAVLLSTVFARSTVFVKPRQEAISLREIMVAFDSSVSKNLVQQKVIPSELLELKKQLSLEFDSAGKEFIEDRARGKTVIYNRFSSSPQSLVLNTRFLTDSGALFRLNKGVLVPGAKIEEGKVVPQSVEVELVADVPGEGSNISGEVALHIPGFKGTPKYEGFYAIAPAGFSGGLRGEARVVGAEDLKKSQEEVSRRVFDELNQELSKKVPAGFKFMEAMREIEIVKVNSPKEKARMEKFTVEAEARGRALIFLEEDVISFLEELILKEEPDKKFIDGSHSLNYHIKNIDFEKGRAEATIGGEIKTKFVIKEGDLSELIQGKKEGSIIEILKDRDDIAKFRLSFFPPWISKAPASGEKIKIVVEEP